MADQTEPATNAKIAETTTVEHTQAMATCADGCFWVNHHPANSPVWVKRCSFCGAMDGDDLRQQVELIVADAFAAVYNALDRRVLR